MNRNWHAPRLRPCPPGLTQRLPGGPCLPAKGTPFGGPGSGLWPSGQSQPAPQPPLPTGVEASLFSDCFAECAGTLTMGSPGPVCGWAFDERFLGTGSGEVVLSPGQMSFDVPTSSEWPSASKAMDLSSFLDTTLQYTFSEFPGTGGVGNASYEILINKALGGGIFRMIDILFFDSGEVIVFFGEGADGDNYDGIWMPNGGTHEVHLTIDADGIPRLWIDGTEIALSFFGTLPVDEPETDPDTVNFNAVLFEGPGALKSSVVTNVFVTEGVLPPDTEFSCP